MPRNLRRPLGRSNRRSVWLVGAVSTTIAVELLGLEQLHDLEEADQLLEPRHAPGGTACPRSSSDEHAPFAAAAQRRRTCLRRTGLSSAAGSSSAANSPPSPLPGTSLVGLPASFFFSTSERPGRLQRDEQHLLLGSFSERFRREGRGERRLAHAALSAEQVQNSSVTHCVVAFLDDAREFRSSALPPGGDDVAGEVAAAETRQSLERPPRIPLSGG